MKIEVNLDDSESCEGCPVKISIWNEFAEESHYVCSLFILDFYPIRPQECIDQHGVLKMTESEEKSYKAGSHSANLSLLSHCLTELGYDIDKLDAIKLIKEREETIRLLRTVCPEFGDNNWHDDLHLVDIIDKHLLNYVLNR